MLYIEAIYLAGLDKIDCGRYLHCHSAQKKPVIRRENYQGHLNTNKILLVRQVLIAGEQKIEAGLLRCFDKGTILQLTW